MFKRVKKNERLEGKLKTLQMNFENNYKDAARLNYEEYWRLLKEQSEAGILTKRQEEHYRQQGEALRAQMDNFNHQNNVKSF